MTILHYPNDILRQKTRAIEKVTPELLAIAQEMYMTMIGAGGVGLAANQCGLDISLIVLEDEGKPLAMFNPIILMCSKDLEYRGEGCLSFPGVNRMIKRPKDVHIKYRDINNKMQYIVLKGLMARAAIHEIEHLSGKLFIDHEIKLDNISNL